MILNDDKQSEINILDVEFIQVVIYEGFIGLNDYIVIHYRTSNCAPTTHKYSNDLVLADHDRLRRKFNQITEIKGND